jgi:hypothetical protein
MDFPDRSKQRRPGMLSSTLSTARDVADTVSGYGSGKIGNIKYETDIFSNLGQSLLEGVLGGNKFGGSGKSAIERSLFGIEFDAGDDRYVSAHTRPRYGSTGITRDYNIAIGKRF